MNYERFQILVANDIDEKVYVCYDMDLDFPVAQGTLTEVSGYKQLREHELRRTEEDTTTE